MTGILIDPKQHVAQTVRHRQRLREHDGLPPLHADEIAAIERQARRDANHQNRITESEYRYRLNRAAAVRLAGEANASATGEPTAVTEPLALTDADTVTTQTPAWAWEHENRGRILRGALTLFAGRPAAGKSTTARWFAASWTNGSLSGCWDGKPVNVAYIATEESLSHTVVPSLLAAGADMKRIKLIRRGADPARINARAEERALTDLLLLGDIRVVVLDPLMSTLGGGTDAYRSNEVREALEPWSRIAEAIDGVVLGITHLTKAARDVTAGINGSSAFGEVARCVFGFAVDKEADDGTRVMTQSKNSAGAEGLSLAYRIGEKTISMDDGGTAAMARFELIGATDKTVGQLLAADQDGGRQTKGSQCEKWLNGFLTVKGPRPSIEVKAAGADLGFSETLIKRAAQKLNIQQPRQKMDNGGTRTMWALPGWEVDP